MSICACRTYAVGLWIVLCDQHRGDRCQLCGTRPATFQADVAVCDACQYARLPGGFPHA